jgi:acetylglutamate kinase
MRTLERVETVLVDRIDPELVGLLNQHGDHAIGLNGKEGRLSRSTMPTLPGTRRHSIWSGPIRTSA